MTTYKNYNALSFKLDNEAGTLTDLSAYVNSMALAGSMNLIDGTVMNTEEVPKYPGTAGSTFTLNGLVNSTTEAIFAPLVGNRTSITKTFEYHDGINYITGEAYPSNVEISGDPDSLELFSCDFTVDDHPDTVEITTWAEFRDLFSVDVAAGGIDGTAATPGSGNRSATDTEGLGYITDPRLILPAQASASWGDLVVSWTAITRATGRCMAMLINPHDAEASFSAGLATSTPSGDPRGNGTGWCIIDGSPSLSAATPYGAVSLSIVRAVIPSQYLMVVACNDIGSYVLLSCIDANTGTGFGSTDTLGVPAYPSARLLWVDYSDSTASLIPYISNGDGTFAVSAHDMRIVDVSTWTAADYLAAFSDRFTRDDSNTVLGNDWTAHAGVFGISSNAAYQVSGTGRAIASHATSLTSGDALWHWRVKFPTGNKINLPFRIADGSNFIVLIADGTNLYFSKLVGGGYSTIAGTSKALSAGTTYDFDIISIGNQYAFFIDGVNAFGSWQTDSGSSHVNETRIGIATEDNPSGELFDNVACYPLTVTLPAELQLGTVPEIVTGGATLGSDTFTDANDTRLNAHTPTAGSAWTEHLGTWTVQSNKASVTGTGDTALVTQELSTTDAECEVTITTPGSGDTFYAGIVCRLVDDNDWFIARIFMNPTQPSNDEMEFTRSIDGVSQLVRKAYLGDYFATGTDYTLKVQCSGSWINIFLDGLAIASHYVEAGEPNGTKFGLYRDPTNDAGCVFDGWSAKAL